MPKYIATNDFKDYESYFFLSPYLFKNKMRFSEPYPGVISECASFAKYIYLSVILSHLSHIVISLFFLMVCNICNHHPVLISCHKALFNNDLQ